MVTIQSARTDCAPCRLKAAFPLQLERRLQAADATTCDALHSSTHPRRDAAWLMIELLVAISLLLFALLPLAWSFASEQRLGRALYQRAVAMEIVDGELEVLAAGAWHSFTNGLTEYQVHSFARTNLPLGQFWLSVSPDKIRLEWRPKARDHGGGVMRELALKQ